MALIQAKRVQSIKVKDPDTNNMVDVVIVKLSNGAMMGIDESFLANTDEPVYSPYGLGEEICVDDI